MKRIIFILGILFSATGFVAAVALICRMYFGISQGVTEDRYGVLCHSSECYATYVWYHGDIVQSWYDDDTTLTDSIKDDRLKQGKKLLKTLSR